MTVMATIAPSPGPLSKRFGQTIDAILRKDNIEHWNGHKDSELDTGKVIVVNVQEEITDVDEGSVEDAVAEEDDDVVIISDTPGNAVVKEEVAIDEEDSDNDDIEGEESNYSTEVQVEDVVNEAITTEKVEIVSEEADDDIVYYKDAQVEYEFGEMRKENSVYFVPLRKAVLIQTPVVKLLEPISGDSTIVRVSSGFAKFVKNHEENMLKLVKENKSNWFKNEIDESALDSGFKSFLESDTLKVKISEDFAAFDTDGGFIDNTFCTPAEVRCILKISGVWFGSSEFGSIMSLVQTQLVKLPKCSIKPTRERKKYNYNYTGDFS